MKLKKITLGAAIVLVAFLAGCSVGGTNVQADNGKLTELMHEEKIDPNTYLRCYRLKNAVGSSALYIVENNKGGISIAIR